jgi:hypothetical protein
MNNNKHKITKKKNKKAHKNKKSRSVKRKQPKPLNFDLEGGVRPKGQFSAKAAENIRDKKIKENIINNCAVAENDPIKDLKKASDILGLPQDFMNKDYNTRDKMLKKARSYKLSICKEPKDEFDIKTSMKDVNFKKYLENIEKAFNIIDNQIKAEKEALIARLCISALNKPDTFVSACAVLELDPTFINNSEQERDSQFLDAVTKKQQTCPKEPYLGNILTAIEIIDTEINNKERKKVEQAELEARKKAHKKALEEDSRLCNSAFQKPTTFVSACDVLELDQNFINESNSTIQLETALAKKKQNCPRPIYLENIEAAYHIIKNEINKRKPPQEGIELQDMAAFVEEDGEEEDDDEEEDAGEEDAEDGLEDLELELQLQDLKQIAIQTKCDEENDNYVGVGINTQLYNNCYLNAVLQMLYHMCYFREGLLNEKVKLPNNQNGQIQEKAVQDLKYIFQEYSKAKDKNKNVITLNNTILHPIKHISIINQDDQQEDPSQVIYHLLPIVDETTNNLSDNTIFGANKAALFEGTAALPYIYSLSLASSSATSLQALITANPNTLQHINQSLSTQKDMQKYMIFQIARYNIINRAASKMLNFIKPSIVLNFSYQKDGRNVTAQFRLKGIIVHLGRTINDGHYVYITYAKNGNISGIYNNGEVTTINGKNINRTGSSGGQLDMKNFLENTQTLVNQNGYLFLYEIINDLLDAPLQPVLSIGPNAPGSEDEEEEEGSAVRPPTSDAPGSEEEEEGSAVRPPASDAPGSEEGSERGDAAEINAEPPAPAITPVAPPPALNAVPQVITPENKITEATRIAKKLFGIPDNKTVNKEDLKRRYEQLKYKIDKYKSNDNDVKSIIESAYAFLDTMPQSLTRFDPTYKDKLKSFFIRLSSSDKTQLNTFIANFVKEYKALTFNKSMIKLRLQRDNSKTEKIVKLCNSVSKLSRQIYTRKIIPSQLPNLLEKKDVPETKKIFISDRKEREQRAAEEAEKKKIEINKAKEKGIQDRLNSIRELYENPDELTEGAIKQKLDNLFKQLDRINKSPTDPINSSKIENIQTEIIKLEDLLRKKKSDQQINDLTKRLNILNKYQSK